MEQEEKAFVKWVTCPYHSQQTMATCLRFPQIWQSGLLLEDEQDQEFELLL